MKHITAFLIKGILITASCLLVWGTEVKAAIDVMHVDTIDFWHVKYNNKIVGKYDALTEKRLIILKRNTIKPTDIMLIGYFRDTPCYDCITTIKIENTTKELFIVENSKGTFTPIKLNMKKFIGAKRQIFKVYYYDEKQPEPFYIFSIKLE